MRIAFAHARAGKFIHDLLLRFAQHQGFGLSETIGNQLGVVLTQIFMGVGGEQEVARDNVGALVDQLIKGVLAIGARFAPNDGTGGAGDGFVFLSYGLAITLHVLLLQIGGKAVHALVIG